jgi:hypothetical protein
LGTLPEWTSRVFGPGLCYPIDHGNLMQSLVGVIGQIPKVVEYVLGFADRSGDCMSGSSTFGCRGMNSIPKNL